jgi:hypothetical protein
LTGDRRSLCPEPLPTGGHASRRFALLSALFASAITCLIVASGALAAPAKFTLEYCDPAIPQTSDPFLTFAVNPPEGVPVRWFNDCLKPGGSIGIQEVGNSEDADAVLSVDVPATAGGYVESESIDNSCTESAVGGGRSLDAAFARAHNEAVTLRYGKGAEVTGTLAGGSGQPISGATICVQTQAEGAETGLVPVGTATTDSQGDFSYALGAGPNRQILFGYRNSSFQVTRTLAVFSHARATLKAGPRKLRNGQRVELTGSLPEPKAAGRVVVLQANVPGSHRWITFRKATTGERGFYKARYHFTSTTRHITYRFRAVVPHQAGYPWLQGISRPVSVSVRK